MPRRYDTVRVRPKRGQLPQNQHDVLAALDIYDAWARPIDVGGRDGTHHTMTLRLLLKKGLVERKLRAPLINQLRSIDIALYERLFVEVHRRGRKESHGSYEYRITDAGRKAIA